MALANYEAEQRILGNIEAAEAARKLIEEHGDLRAVAVTEHGVVMPSEEFRAKLEQSKFRTKVYPLSGRKYGETLGWEWRDFSLQQSPEYGNLQQQRSRKSWVAFTPYALAELEIGYNKTYDEIMRDVDPIISAYNEEMQERLGTDQIEAVLGTLPDYSEAGLTYLRREGAFLGELRGYTLTSTKIDGYPTVIRFDLETLVAHAGMRSVKIHPLIFPKQASASL